MADIELELLSRAIMTGGIDQLIAAGIEVDLLRRIFARVNFNGPVPEHDPSLGNCWVCIRSVKPNGYASITYKGKTANVHRLAFVMLVGDIPDGLELDHLCRNRACIRPYHLEPVTRLENQVRGEGFVAMHVRKTHCKNGHAFSTENTYVHRGHRYCRACRKINKARYRGG
jgi:hypothetical protein